MTKFAWQHVGFLLLDSNLDMKTKRYQHLVIADPASFRFWQFDLSVI